LGDERLCLPGNKIAASLQTKKKERKRKKTKLKQGNKRRKYSLKKDIFV